MWAPSSGSEVRQGEPQEHGLCLPPADLLRVRSCSASTEQACQSRWQPWQVTAEAHCKCLLRRGQAAPLAQGHLARPLATDDILGAELESLESALESGASGHPRKLGVAVRVTEPFLGTTGVGIRSVRLFGGMLTFPASMSECFTKWKASFTVWTSHRWGPYRDPPPPPMGSGAVTSAPRIWSSLDGCASCAHSGPFPTPVTRAAGSMCSRGFEGTS